MKVRSESRFRFAGSTECRRAFEPDTLVRRRTPMRPSRLLLCAAAVALAALTAGCSASPTTCGAATCSGCCAGNECMTGLEVSACGQSGFACQTCVAGQVCMGHVCSSAGGGGGSGGGTGGGAAGGTAGGSAGGTGGGSAGGTGGGSGGGTGGGSAGGTGGGSAGGTGGGSAGGTGGGSAGGAGGGFATDAGSCTSLGLVDTSQAPFCWAHPRPFGSSVSSMTAHSGRWWVSSDEGLFDSVDHVRWTNRAPEPGPFGPVTTDGTILIVPTERGVFTSATGATWQRVSTTVFSLVEKRGSTWVGLHYSTGISSSADGVSWTVRVPGSTFFPAAIAFADGLWIVAGSDASSGGSLRTSADGITWTTRAPGGSAEPFLSTIATDGTNVVVMGSDTPNNRRAVFTSSNGINWTSRTPFHTSSVSSLGFLGGAFFAATSANGVFTSTDGQAWSPVSGSPNFSLLTHTSLGWLGVYRTTSDYVFSSDGLTWAPWRESLVRFTNISVTSLAHADAGFVALIDRRGAVSVDGLSWSTSPDAGATSFGTPAFGNGRWVAAGGSNLMTSTNGTVWSPLTSTASYPDAVAFGNNTWVLTASSNTAFRSTDGLSWTQVTNPGLTGSAVANGFLTFAGGLFVRVKDTLCTSVDGTSWNQRVGFGASLSGVAFGGGRWVAIPMCFSSGTQTPALTSTDGITWTPVTASPALCGNAVAYGPGGFAVLIGGAAAPFRDSVLRVSSDGLTWNRSLPIGSPYAASLESGAGRWVIGSAFGAIFVSPGAL